jgi:hypothetical protein
MATRSVRNKSSVHTLCCLPNFFNLTVYICNFFQQICFHQFFVGGETSSFDIQLFCLAKLVGIVTDWTARVRFPAVQNFSLLHIVKTDPGAHPASCSMGTDGSSLGVKRQGREADHSHLVQMSVKLELYPHSLIPLHGIVFN